MLADDENFASSVIPKSKVARFLDHALKIEESQYVYDILSTVNPLIYIQYRRKLKHLIQDTAEHELQSRKKEITIRTTKLRKQLSDFRQDQKHFMPKIGDKVAAQTTAAPPVQLEQLYLPSEFTEKERQEFDLVQLGLEEARWREGQAFDILRALQNIVKAMRVLRGHKIKQDRQQKQNSRAGDHIAEAAKRRDHHMEAFNVAHAAIVALVGSSQFPALTQDDLFMKSVHQKRQVGDSKRTDGLLFRAKALGTFGSHDIDTGGDIQMDGSQGPGSQAEAYSEQCEWLWS